MPLNSTSTIKLVDVIAEGPIEGLEQAENSVFLNETPIKTGDTRNYERADVNYDFRLGGRTQSEVSQAKGFASTLTNVNLEVGENYSEDLNANSRVLKRSYGPGTIIRSILDTDIDSIELLFTLPRLYSTSVEGLAKGQLFNASIRIDVFIQSQGSAFNREYTRTVTGVSTSGYQIKTPRIELKGTGPWNIKVEKVDLGEDHFEVKFKNFRDVDKDISLASGRANSLIWSSIFEIQNQRLSYAYTALGAVSLSTKAFSSVPARAWKIKGLKIEVPHNAIPRDDGSLKFQGTFNGTSRIEWTTCPVCAFRDLLLNKRYGSGDYVEAANLSWVDLYPLIQYANQQVTNPDGSKEARFAINTVIGSQADAYSVLKDLASIFRGFTYWYSDIIQVNADHGQLDGTNTAPVHLYTNSNVIGGVFNYSGSSLKVRSTSIRVAYNDPQNFYRRNLVVIEDASLISKYGYQTRDLIAFGTTSKYQAQRLGRWILNTEKLNGEVVSFTTGLDGGVCKPGEVIAIADELRAGSRLSGRINSATTSAIIADQTITLPAGDNPEISTILKNGTYEKRAINSVSDKTITVETSFTSAPANNAIWSITTDSVEEQKFRILEVKEDAGGTYTISAAIFNDTLYDAVDEGEDLGYLDVTTFDDSPTTPTDLTIVSKRIRINNNNVNRTVASWGQPTSGFVTAYDVRWKIGEGNYNISTITSPSHEIDGLQSGGVLTFEVRSVGSISSDKKSAWATATYTIPEEGVDDQDDEIITPPLDPTNVEIAVNGGNVLLSWGISGTGYNTDYWKAIIKHTPVTDGSGSWTEATKLGETKASSRSINFPLMEGEYLVKFEDENGLRSGSAGSAIVSLPDDLPRLNIQVKREDTASPPFQGQKNQVFYSDEFDGLVLDGQDLWDDETDDIDDWTQNIDFLGTRFTSGRYFFTDTIDLGGKFSIEFSRRLKSRGLIPSDTIDARETNLDRWTDFDGTLPDDTTADMYFRKADVAVTNDNIDTEDGDNLLTEDSDKIQQEMDVDFSDWQPMYSGRYTGRLFQFKVEMSADVEDQTPIVDELGYTLQLLSRTEESTTTIASGAGSKAVTYSKAFYQTPNIGITALNLGSGDYYVISSESRTGFSIIFRNSSGSAIDKNFKYQAVGYGAEES